MGPDQISNETNRHKLDPMCDAVVIGSPTARPYRHPPELHKSGLCVGFFDNQTLVDGVHHQCAINQTRFASKSITTPVGVYQHWRTTLGHYHRERGVTVRTADAQTIRLWYCQLRRRIRPLD